MHFIIPSLLVDSAMNLKIGDSMITVAKIMEKGTVVVHRKCLQFSLKSDRQVIDVHKTTGWETCYIFFLNDFQKLHSGSRQES